MKHHLTGKKFRVSTSRKTFTILDGETYVATKVSKRYKMILSFKPGLLVAVSFRGTLIPNLTGGNGVVRLTKVEINGEVFDKPSTISAALGIKLPMVAYIINKC